jgi:hypothetical protein
MSFHGTQVMCTCVDGGSTCDPSLDEYVVDTCEEKPLFDLLDKQGFFVDSCSR